MHSLLGDELAGVYRVGVQLNHRYTVTSKKEILIEDTQYIFFQLDRQID